MSQLYPVLLVLIAFVVISPTVIYVIKPYIRNMIKRRSVSILYYDDVMEDVSKIRHNKKYDIFCVTEEDARNVMLHIKRVYDIECVLGPSGSNSQVVLFRTMVMNIKNFINPDTRAHVTVFWCTDDVGEVGCDID